jgi:hypothetical protein
MNWIDVYVMLTTTPQRAVVHVDKHAIGHPAAAGAKRAWGLPIPPPETCDATGYRFPPDMVGRGLHVHDCGGYWRAHLDAVHPGVDLLGHIRHDVLSVAPRGRDVSASAAATRRPSTTGHVAGSSGDASRGAGVSATRRRRRRLRVVGDLGDAYPSSAARATRLASSRAAATRRRGPP